MGASSIMCCVSYWQLSDRGSGMTPGDLHSGAAFQNTVDSKPETLS